ncbi:MAG: hypothetical protein WCA08_19815 [Desulfoferrobacter sp.]
MLVCGQKHRSTAHRGIMVEYVFKLKKGDIIDADTYVVIISKIPTEKFIDNFMELEKVLKDTEIIIRTED